MTSQSGGRQARRLGAVLREGEQVTPLELFFDLVFVLAITQCTALMAAEPTWHGLAKGILVLGMLWWAWVGYAWLTSVVDPEEGVVRLAIFGAMAALLVVSLCVPRAFDELGLTFAVAYGIVRAGQLGLFLVAGRDAPAMRRSVWTGLVPSTAAGVGLLAVASGVHGVFQGAIWATALSLDMLGPYLFGSEGWKLVPRHFAERHGLVFLIALGESIVAIGVGAPVVVDAGVITAAVLGVGLAASMWWVYFDVSAIGAANMLADAAVGKEQNELARDAYSFLHFPMVAGVVLISLGLRATLAQVDQPLGAEASVALVGGLALYLLAHVVFRLRVTGTVNWQRLAVALVLLATTPLVQDVDAVVTLAGAVALMAALIAYEVVRFREGREQLRHAAPRPG